MEKLAAIKNNRFLLNQIMNRDVKIEAKVTIKTEVPVDSLTVKKRKLNDCSHLPCPTNES
jgi:hypothetical protein